MQIKEIEDSRGRYYLRKAFRKDIPEINKISSPPIWTEIGSKAFKEAFDSPECLSDLKIPEGVISIRASAFENTPYLQKITLPSTIERIYSAAFLGSGIKEITIPQNISIIKHSTFSNCMQLEQAILPDGIKILEPCSFFNCHRLKEINIPNSVEQIDSEALAYCTNLKSIIIPSEVKSIHTQAFHASPLKSIFFANDGDVMLCAVDSNNNPVVKIPSKFTERRELNPNMHFKYTFRQNLAVCSKLKRDKQITFFPQDYVLAIFPTESIQSFFANNNHLRWRSLVSSFLNIYEHEESLGISELNAKNYFLTDLFKIYYAIGGFSTHQGESEKAYNYTLNHIIPPKDGETSIKHAQSIHNRFSRLELPKAYHQGFAQFFMRYFHKNNDFMLFDTKFLPQDFLCRAHNNWTSLTKAYPNRVVNGNDENSLFTPEFVAKHCQEIHFNNVEPGNEKLANLIAQYGYTQSQFEEIQAVFDFAKTIKEKSVIKANKSIDFDCIQFRILEKDDPLGFVLGDITNCCQVWGGAAKSCVVDGYENPNSAFLVFEENIKDESGSFTGKTRILGQAYVWYDPITQTVCYDNIEVPRNILKELTKTNPKHNHTLSELLDIIEASAISIAETMNQNGIPVKEVTTGTGFNDLNKYLKSRHPAKQGRLAKNRTPNIYSDALESQLVIHSLE